MSPVNWNLKIIHKPWNKMFQIWLKGSCNQMVQGTGYFHIMNKTHKIPLFEALPFCDYRWIFFVFAWWELDASHQTIIQELAVDAFLDSRRRKGPLREPCGSTTFPLCTFSSIRTRHKYNLLLLSSSNLIPSTYQCCYQLTFPQPITVSICNSSELVLLSKT
jgi:hypothetical protein